jgi:hypothetical protein
MVYILSLNSTGISTLDHLQKRPCTMREAVHIRYDTVVKKHMPLYPVTIRFLDLSQALVRV